MQLTEEQSEIAIKLIQMIEIFAWDSWDISSYWHDNADKLLKEVNADIDWVNNTKYCEQKRDEFKNRWWLIDE